jgi:hypothetical protein
MNPNGVGDRWLRSAGGVAVAATTTVTAVFGWYAMWSAPVNGDESYLLVTLREWLLRGGLYDRVYSQYGPFYYFIFGVPSRLLGDRFTLAGGRLASLLLWIVAAFLFGITVKAITGRWMFGIAGQVLSFSVLSTLVNEPMHPGALLCSLLAALLANVAWLRPRAPVLSDGLSGAAAAALLLTKVNVGLFAIVALAFVAARGARHPGWRWVTSAALLALGPALLLANGQEPWRLLWASIYVTGTFFVIVASRLHRERTPLTFNRPPLATGFAVVALASVGTMLATGTSAPDLLRGVFIRPLDHAQLITIPLHIPAWAWTWLLVIPLVVVPWKHRAISGSRQLVTVVSAGARVVAGLALIASVLGSDLLYLPGGSRFSLLPLAALVLVPLHSQTQEPANLLARGLLAASALTESLHAFPVPGSQVSWSVVTAGVAAVVIVADGVEEMVSLPPVRAYVHWATFAGALCCLALVLIIPGGVALGVTTPGAQFRAWSDAYDHQRTLGIDGSQWLRPPASQRGVILATVPIIRRECDTFLTLGAGLSWYILADRRPPTGFNQPTWPAYLDEHEQRATIAALRNSGRICLVLNAYGGGFRGGRITAFSHFQPRVLVAYLERMHWALVGEAGDVQVLQARGVPHGG